MGQPNETRRSETRENDSEAGSEFEGEQPVNFRLRNLTGGDFSLIYRSGDGSELLRRYPAEQTKVRVRYNRFFDTTPTEWYNDPEGTNAKIPMVESRPRAGLLPTCETIDGLPPAEGGVRLVVRPEVVFGLARRDIFRRDLLTLGRARKDPVTQRVIGFENLSRVNFDAPPELEEVPALIPQEDSRAD